MGCKCKETAATVQKYTKDRTLEELHGFKAILFLFRKIITVVLALLVFIIAVPFLIIFVIIRVIRGKKIKLNLTKIIKAFHVKTE